MEWDAVPTAVNNIRSTFPVMFGDEVTLTSSIVDLAEDARQTMYAMAQDGRSEFDFARACNDAATAFRLITEFDPHGIDREGLNALLDRIVSMAAAHQK